jgi:hypothetical protein
MRLEAGPASYHPLIWSEYNSLLIQCVLPPYRLPLSSISPLLPFLSLWMTVWQSSWNHILITMLPRPIQMHVYHVVYPSKPVSVSKHGVCSILQPHLCLWDLLLQDILLWDILLQLYTSINSLHKPLANSSRTF